MRGEWGRIGRRGGSKHSLSRVVKHPSSPLTSSLPPPFHPPWEGGERRRATPSHRHTNIWGTLQGPGASHQNSTERPPREGRKNEHFGGRGKKREILGSPFGAHPSGPHLSGTLRPFQETPQRPPPSPGRPPRDPPSPGRPSRRPPTLPLPPSLPENPPSPENPPPPPLPRRTLPEKPPESLQRTPREPPEKGRSC